MKVVEKPEILVFLKKRNLVSQYKKRKEFLKLGFLKNIDFKILQPKHERKF